MRVGAALSRVPVARQAALEAAMEARASLDMDHPSLAVLFASSHFANDAEAVLDAVHEAVAPATLIGCVGESIVGGELEVEHEPAVSVWLAELPSAVEALRIEFTPADDGGVVSGWPENARGAFLMIADPFTFPADTLLHHANEHSLGTTIIGGLASGGMGSGSTRLFLNDEVLTSGAVAAALPDEVEIVTLVSQGCKPLGQPFTITRAERNVILELGGLTPVERVSQLYASLPNDDQQLLAQGLLIGRVIDEHKLEPERGDFLIRSVIGADPSSGALVVGDAVKVGETVQFHVRDAASADEDLDAALTAARRELGNRTVSGALLFTCNGRGSRMFSTPSHDASLVANKLERLPLAGFFAAGELGPIGGRNFLHGFTASMVLFCD
jgi:small ligand-binding sensory domain FIST